MRSSTFKMKMKLVALQIAAPTDLEKILCSKGFDFSHDCVLSRYSHVQLFATL